MLELNLAQFASVPIGHETLLSLLHGYRRPNDKISQWVKKGVLIALKRGLYLVGESWRTEGVVLPLIANRLYGPSCVSLEYALSWHGWIPERVHNVTSVCLARGCVIHNPVGHFLYFRLPPSVYPVGIVQETSSKTATFLIAHPEKALCDKILLTRHLDVFSITAMQNFLFADLRLEPEALADCDLSIVQTYAQAGWKQRQFAALLLVLEKLQCR